MSKPLGSFIQKAQGVKNAPSKFTSSAVEGSRLLFSRNKDAEVQFRIDAGHYDEDTKRLNVVLQVNSQAKSPALKEWIKKNSTHGKLATASFDTSAEDKQAEFARMLRDLEEQGKKNLG
ncbi:hypothetical protein Plec18170_008846 [Paecilomyces lecythidis]